MFNLLERIAVDEPSPTRSTLIFRLQQGGDGHAWSEFVEIYTPMVYRLARRQGLQDADAADVTQEVFRAVARSIDGFRFNPSGSSFRGWMYAVTRSRLSNFHSNRSKQVLGSGETAIAERLAREPAPENWDELCEREYQVSLLRWAAGRVRHQFSESTWNAFWRTNVEGKGVREVAESLGMGEGAVYIARSRVLARLRETIREIEI